MRGGQSDRGRGRIPVAGNDAKRSAFALHPSIQASKQASNPPINQIRLLFLRTQQRDLERAHLRRIESQRLGRVHGALFEGTPRHATQRDFDRVGSHGNVGRGENIGKRGLAWC